MQAGIVEMAVHLLRHTRLIVAPHPLELHGLQHKDAASGVIAEFGEGLEVIAIPNAQRAAMAGDDPLRFPF